MLAGELYDASDEELSHDRTKCRQLLRRLNVEVPYEERADVAHELLPLAGIGLDIQPPFYCDYGYNIVMGESCFFNFNCCILDVCK
eukprot:gene11828-13963_t